MKRVIFFVAALSLLLVVALSYQDFRSLKAKTEQPGMQRAEAKLTEPKAANHARVNVAYGKLPLSFEANQGQTDGQVKFIARGRGYSLFLTSNEAVLSLKSKQPQEPSVSKANKGFSKEAAASDSSRALAQSTSNHVINPKDSQIAKQNVVRLKLIGANPNPQIVGAEQLPSKSNYFIGNDPAKWRTNVPTYAKVKYETVYPGVDLIYYGNQGQLEYDFVVAPGADPKMITLGFEGADKIEMDAEGDLVLHTTSGQVRQHKPLIYQQMDSTRKEVLGGYAVNDNNQVSFWVEEYDNTKPLFLDPVVVYSTFLGGSSFDDVVAIAVDAAGCAYVAGLTESTDFPTTAGAYEQELTGEIDVFVAKLNADGSALIYSTFLGGSGGGPDGDWETANDIKVDIAGFAYVIGLTYSEDFPTTAGAFQTGLQGNSDVFVLKLSIDGSTLIYSTLLGGSAIGNLEEGEGIAIDAAGRAIVVGRTVSTNFPTTAGAFQATFGGGLEDAFVTKLSSDGSTLIYSSYLGGSDVDVAESIVFDAVGNIYLTGVTSSTDFPTTAGAFQQTNSGLNDAFVVKLTGSGSALIYSTYLGGSEDEWGESIALDANGRAFVVGETNSSDFPTTAGCLQSTFGGGSEDAFVTKLNTDGSALEFSSYLGGSEGDEGEGIVIDSGGRAYVTGNTASEDFPTTTDAIRQTFGGVEDAFMAKLSTDGSTLVYSTFLGGSDWEDGGASAIDANGRLYMTGLTGSTDFPITASAFQTTFAGDIYDAFVVAVELGTTTEPGSDVEVEPIDESTGETPVAVTFSEVTGDGLTRLNTSSGGPLPPDGFVVGIPTIYYDLNTTATFTGAIEVCIDYSNVTFINESTLQLFHFEGGTWVDVTSSHDAVNDIICGTVTSLSPFAIFENTNMVVNIDIKPGSDDNPINLKSNGVIPVAILSTDDFAATNVDPLSVEFGPNGATESHNKGHIEDADGDGDLDLVLHFKTQSTSIQCGDTEANLTGRTFDDQPISGTDVIQTIGCNSSKAVAEEDAGTPDEYALSQNYPNPFNPETEIRFQLPEGGHVVLSIYNVLGEEIRKLADRQFEAGYHSVRWDGKNQKGNPVASGVYLYRLQVGSSVQVKKMNLVQ